MLRVAAWTLAGNLTVHLLPVLPPPWVAVLVSAAASWLAARGFFAGAAALGAAAITALAAHYALEQRLPAHLVRHDVVVTGYVADFPRHDPDRSVFEFRVVEGPAEVPRTLRLSWYGPDERPVAGQGLRAQVRLRPPRGLLNPGGGDYERWLLTRRIGATGYIRIALDPDARVETPRVLRLRQQLAAAIEAALGEERRATAIVLALTIGARHRLEAADREVLARTGTSHLMAISGLHVGLVAALGLAGFRRLWALLPGPARRIAPLSAGAFAGFLLAGAYALLAGFGIPTRRALLMLVVVLAAILLRRAPRPAQGLALALIVVLAADPLATLDNSFWLSFTAVAVIALVLLRRRKTAPDGSRLQRWRRGLATFCVLQLLVVVGMAPATGVLFSQVPWASPFANALLIPLFSLLVVPAALLGAVGLVLLEPAGRWMLSAAAALLDALWPPLAWLAAHPASVWTVPGLPAWWWLVLGLAAALVLLPRGLPGRWLAIPLTIAALGFRPPAPAPGGFHVMLLDVGQGLGMWVRTANHVLLFDVGPAADEGFDAGAGVVVPALRHFGIDRVDMLVISHEHNDHAGGARAVLAALPVGRVLAGGGIAASLGGEACQDGQQWEWDGVFFEMLHPARPDERGNDGSCVLSVRGDGVSLLLTGDIEARGEARLLAGARLAPHDIVQVAHHGSMTSSHPDVVAATAPRFALVGAGYANQWDHPRPEIVARWKGAGATLLTTGEVGATKLAARPGGEIELLTPWRERQRRYWRAP